MLKSLKLKLDESTDDFEVLDIKSNQCGADAVAGQDDEYIVDEGNFLAP
jgi:hypothetical protein